MVRAEWAGTCERISFQAQRCQVSQLSQALWYIACPQSRTQTDEYTNEQEGTCRRAQAEGHRQKGRRAEGHRQRQAGKQAEKKVEDRDSCKSLCRHCFALSQGCRFPASGEIKMLSIHSFTHSQTRTHTLHTHAPIKQQSLSSIAVMAGFKSPIFAGRVKPGPARRGAPSSAPLLPPAPPPH